MNSFFLGFADELLKLAQVQPATTTAQPVTTKARHASNLQAQGGMTAPPAPMSPSMLPGASFAGVQSKPFSSGESQAMAGTGGKFVGVGLPVKAKKHRGSGPAEQAEMPPPKLKPQPKHLA